MDTPYSPIEEGLRARRGTALVLGAQGKLGRALARRALTRCYFRVVGLDHRACDITRPDHVAAVLDNYHPRVVFNAAAYNQVDEAETAAGRAFRVNAVAPGQLAEQCFRRGIRLVHFSTDYVFAGRETPYRESDPTDPLSRYGWSKAEGERAVLAAGKDHLVIRVCGLYDEQAACFPRTVIERVLRQGRIEVIDERWGALTWVEPLAALVGELSLLEPGGIVHATPPDVSPWTEIARRVLDLAGVEGEVVPVSAAQQQAAARRPTRAQLDPGRVRELGWPGLPPWREGLQQFFAERGGTMVDEIRRQLAARGAATAATDRGAPGATSPGRATEPTTPGAAAGVAGQAPRTPATAGPPGAAAASPATRVTTAQTAPSTTPGATAVPAETPTKGILLAGGTGSRLKELLQGRNKHLLEVGDRPMLAHGIEALVAAGVRELLVVTGREHLLEVSRTAERHLPAGVRLEFGVQARPLGTADALLQAWSFARGEPLAVLLGDNLFGNPLRPLLAVTPEQAGAAVLALVRVPDLTDLGMAEVEGERVVALQEKPDLDRLPPLSPGRDRLAVAGLYRLPGDALERLLRVRPSARGELELMDAFQDYLAEGRLLARRVEGWWLDAGTPERLEEARRLAREG